MTHHHLSHSVRTLPCCETCRLSENTFLPQCKQNTTHAHVPRWSPSAGFLFSLFLSLFALAFEKLCSMMLISSLFGFRALCPQASNAPALGGRKKTHVNSVQRNEEWWKMQCKNAVAAARAVKCGLKALCSQSQPEKKACSRTKEETITLP